MDTTTRADNSLHRSRLAGGQGRDEFQFLSADPDGLKATGDLRRGRFVVEDEGTFNDIRADLAGIEDLAFEGREVSVKGSNAANRLQVTGCKVSAEGRRGSDQIIRAVGDRFAGQNCLKRLRPSNLIGGPGNDRLTGANFVDTLIGGPGRDTADGRKGSDLCRAEIERSCERN